MAEVIWSDNATGWRIDALAYGSSTFGQKSAEKLDNIFKTYSYTDSSLKTARQRTEY